MSGQARGAAIDETDVPAWAHRYLSPGQLKLNRALVWMLLFYKRTGLDSSRYNIAQRLYVYTVGKDHKEANPGYKSLATELNMAENTAIASVHQLMDEGWLVTRGARRYPTFRLAWPTEDVIAQAPGKVEVKLCGRPTSKGGACKKRAGRGTKHQGEGPCIEHEETPEPQPLRLEDEAETDSEPQPLRFTSVDNPPDQPQPLRFDPVDNPEIRTRSTATTADLNRNRCGSEPQPQRISTATVAAEYVRSTSGVREEYESGVLAVGELTVRTARTTATAPTAQPDNLTARGIIAATPRYRAAPAWVRKHLIALATHALEAGFAREVILQYAHQVIAERTYADHQHIPELRGALQRLGRDVALGTTCPRCGGDPTGPSFCCVDPATAFRVPTPEDLEAFTRGLDQLGVTPDQLDPAGSA
ncbi:hypothetical protein DQ384_26125 [Sphaerisporangium album]|uniref:Helix-turn-helix domain-containing protein n=1 Tax=Sphaerisporangium album TaxID=509200 RepID=A0A367FB74_9ACTN|nr:hypothetical protein [Sphaerisporangium album]RCG27199.1 hypothetical protein DQ384_26125 [Sphaerisporangium album]